MNIMDLKLGKPLHELLCKNVGIELDFVSFLFQKKNSKKIIFAFEHKHCYHKKDIAEPASGYLYLHSGFPKAQ